MQQTTKGFIRTMVAGTLALLMASCNGPTDGSLDDSFTSDLRFDIAGAKAVAGNSSAARSVGSKSLSQSRASSLASLVRINDDGTLASAISFGTNNGGGWTPDVSFISVDTDKSVYICFSQPYQSWTSSTSGTSTSSAIQFVRVYPDNTYDVLWPLDPANYSYNTSGQVNVWSWWGMDSDPLQRGADGKVYFKVTTYSGGTNNDSIYAYDPSVGGKPVLRTPANGTLTIESFKIDSQNHLLLKSANYGTGTASYLRCYSSGVIAPANIYYSSDANTTWVRGYTTSPMGNSVILNGYNINSMSGIIRANILSPSSISYDLLYSNTNNTTWINLCQYANNSWVNPTAIIAQDTSWQYAWSSAVCTNGILDKAKLLAIVAPYYLGDADITSEMLSELASININDYDSSAWWTSTYGSNLGNFINSYGETFLKHYFTGTLFNDWLATNHLTDLNLGNIGAMIWGSDGSLYGLYDSGWWNGGNSSGTKVLKLLDNSGKRALSVINLAHGMEKPTKIKLIGGYLYYRYAVMNGSMETGTHKLARYNFSANNEEELLSVASLASKNLEIQSYDVSSDGTTMFISALDYDTNAVIFGKIDLVTKVFTQIQSDTAYNTVRTF